MQDLYQMKELKVSAESSKSSLYCILVPPMFVTSRNEKIGTTANVLVKLESEDFANVLASFLLSHEIELLGMFAPLRKCIYRHFDDQVLLPVMFLGEHSMENNTLIASMSKAFNNDDNIITEHVLIENFKKFLMYFGTNFDSDVMEFE